MRAYVDSDILIWHLRGERRAAALLRALSREPGIELWTGALQRGEIVFFMRPDEAPGTMSFLSRGPKRRQVSARHGWESEAT